LAGTLFDFQEGDAAHILCPAYGVTSSSPPSPTSPTSPPSSLIVHIATPSH